ncbi:unnamed protein product [Blepharisma stoltei]|uniref:Uncharacterized protein n=1 Tax=Blepharisma stoltei TaxID=1481888 RepID=A0AAU9IEG4_9CILI|nr:unnamed protein product [Blepharisma stoltei]
MRRQGMYQLISKRKAKICLDFLVEDRLIKETGEMWEKFRVFKIEKNNHVLFEFLGESEEDCKVWNFRKGVIYLTENLFGYADERVQCKLKREKIINVFVSQNNAYFLENNEIHKFNYSHIKRKHKGVFKMPRTLVLKIENFNEYFSPNELKKVFFFLESSNMYSIASEFKIGIIKHGNIIQSFRISESIRGIKEISKEITIEGSYNDFKIEKKQAVLPKQVQNPAQKFKPSIKAMQALENSEAITETIDLFWHQELKGSLENKLISDWHLQPLDRVFLSSQEFYQDYLYDYIKNYLSLTVQGFYHTNPDALLLLQEALREQEQNLYGDGLVKPNQPLSTLIKDSLPFATQFDNPSQTHIHTLFS